MEVGRGTDVLDLFQGMSEMKRLRRVFAGIVLLGACSRADSGPPLEGPSAEEYAVWSAAVDSRFGPRPLLVVREQTYGPEAEMPSDARQLRESSRLSRELVDDYLARNGHPVPVHAGRLHARSVRLLPELQGPAGTVADWVSDGRLTLSRPGFDRGGKRAMVTLTFNCGGLCGGGATLVLERDGSGRWHHTSTMREVHF